jgi:ABC-type nitrate/sulfonate/bicarbonate transport system substrate-binding protein
VRAFIAAWFDAVGLMQTPRAETVASARAITGLDAGVLGREYDDRLAMFTRSGAISKAELARVATAVADTGLTDKPVDLTAYYSATFLPRAASQ